MKRIYDLVLASLGLLLLWPLFLLIAIAVKLSDGGPILFRQTRAGLGGKPFQIVKFRTMVPGAEARGPSVTQAGDPRVTRIGKVLRRAKLDELPQLWNVLVGEMTFVGPRPEVPRYVALYSEHQRRILALKPGITDPAALRFRDEERLLEGARDLDRVYIQDIMPRKIELSLAYARQASRWEDTKIILRTLLPGTERVDL